MNNLFDNLFIFEMANNHCGDLNHAKLIIKTFSQFITDYPNLKFGMKFQMRDKTFIHKKHESSSDIKYVARFKQARLSLDEYAILNNYSKSFGFSTICTPFDEPSVDNIVQIGFDYLKVASCSCNDWPLLNSIVNKDLPVIISTAGASLVDVDNVVSFFSNRKKQFAIMHCIGEYPTEKSHLQLNQIQLLKNRYINIPIGFSTHEYPGDIDSIKIAYAKGASIFEKHIDVETDRHIPNSYSATFEDIRHWIESYLLCREYCGDDQNRYSPTEKEISDLRQFKRGVCAIRDIASGEKITKNDIYYCFPNDGKNGQLLAENISKYAVITSEKNIKRDDFIYFKDVKFDNIKNIIYDIIKNVKKFIHDKNVMLPKWVDIELSYHYGIKNFYNTGCSIITLLNRRYCKKIIIMLPGQTHPEQMHLKKEESFIIHYGVLNLKLNGEEKILYVGDICTIPKKSKHEMTSSTGVIIEEISTTHFKNDSYYTDPEINKNQNRKFITKMWQNEN